MKIGTMLDFEFVKLQQQIMNKIKEAEEKGIICHSIILHPETMREILISDQVREYLGYMPSLLDYGIQLFGLKLNGDVDMAKNDWRLLVQYD